MPDPVPPAPAPSTDAPLRPGGPRPTSPHWPEPPAYRAHPPGPSGACVTCGTSLRAVRAAPRCWECGRALCAECYWRHGLAPAEHRCAGCATRGPAPSVAISGGRLSAAAAPSSSPATAGRS
ncbi:MAG TPA: hypothetical protein VMG36_05575 [Thermoplasmata archaeon]|nr:hypothetical protein [Thermoplasmata archaeon]